MQDQKQINRAFLKSGNWADRQNYETDQKKKLPHPPPQLECPEGSEIISLPSAAELDLGGMPLKEAILRRASHRRFSEESISLDELSFLLWATQGVHRVTAAGTRVYRTVPSAGCRHPFETYLAVSRVDGLSPGLYRYQSIDHQLCRLNGQDEFMADELGILANQQGFVGKGAVCFIWSVIPYRNEWRYAPMHMKVVAIDAGHICQNLYLACTGLGLGTCAIGAYDQERLDRYLGLDGEEEFVAYLAPVGRIPSK